MKSLSLRVLGVMTGTSCDGLDAACMEFTPKGWHCLWTSSAPYPLSLKKEVLTFQSPGSRHSSQEWLKLDQELGKWYGKVLEKMIRTQKQAPEVIANHGQTIAHFPGAPFESLTLQMGNSCTISSATGLSVISHFREGDIAAGGQGAPLSPLFHRILAKSLGKNKPGIAIHNIGGISNLTYLGPSGKVIAFDTGPGNIWIDAAIERATHGRLRIDPEGKISSRGEIDHKALRAILRHPYFSKPIPKSTGRSDFPSEYFFSKTNAKGESLVATATAVTIESITNAYQTWILDKNLPLREILLCGGGAKNLTLLSGLRIKLSNVNILSLHDLGIDPQFIEAQAFAIFGFLSLMGKALGGSWTGSKEFGPPGHLIPGSNWTQILTKAAKFMKHRATFLHSRFLFD